VLDAHIALDVGEDLADGLLLHCGFSGAAAAPRARMSGAACMRPPSAPAATGSWGRTAYCNRALRNHRPQRSNSGVNFPTHARNLLG
jgi:hypothetical protein